MGPNFGPLALAIILAAVLFSAAIYLAPAKTGTINLNPNAQPHLLSLSADASQEVAPDKVEVIFSVVSRGEDPTRIQEENDAKLRAIREHLVSIGVLESNIKTVGYSLDRWTEWNKTLETSVDRGYVLTNSLRVVSYDTSLAGRVIKEAVANGANDVSSVQFSLSDASRKSLYATLMQNATAQVKTKAGQMASAAGVKLVNLNSMNEGYSYVEPTANYYYRNSYDGKAVASAGVSEVSVSAGLVRVSATVSATYELEG